ncbi:glycoside hydrolase family 47 protein [Tulasnella calospora MUT 4182]|uniref:alpha-1,2-Mannosidase n=1 Tax=Tulasnella calospora MUT 4182 TaxID=1051891 RepID=A0A0C3QM23_9AGAM|nr:glycoside hydrolase family 47 protein [Tulasnella calospora MUT 4182]
MTKKRLQQVQNPKPEEPEKPAQESIAAPAEGPIYSPEASRGPRALLLYSLPLFICLGITYLAPDILSSFLGTSKPGSSGRVSGFNPKAIVADVPKQKQVVEAFKYAWHAYERDAFGHDEYHPLSQKGSNLSHNGGIGYMIVDSIDTMMIMGLEEEYERARNWIATKLSFEREGRHSTFETTIRVLGGLLSAYHLSSSHSHIGEPDPIFLEKAVDLGDRLLSAFETPSGLPLPMVNLATMEGISDPDNPGLVSTAEVSTLQLELRYLSELTGDEIYWRTGEKARVHPNVMHLIRNTLKTPLAPVFLSFRHGHFVLSEIRLGSRGDSFYEYLLKQYLQTGRTEPAFKDMYDSAMTAIHENLVQTTPSGRLVFTSELQPVRGYDAGHEENADWRRIPKQDHLVCFLGGSLMLGATDGGNQLDRSLFSDSEKADWRLGEELIKTCMATHNTKTGLSPEIAMFRTPNDPDWVVQNAPSDWYIKGLKGHKPPLDARYILRPETVESLFIAYRLSGDQKYRDWGWQIFKAIEKHCKVATGGYSGVVHVDDPEGKVELDDRMETFMMSETLKYLYLLFSDGNVLPLTDIVFNTEAHPLPVFNPTIEPNFK